MQQVRQFLAVVNMGWCHGRAMNKTGTAVDTDVYLHAKVPLVAILGLMKLLAIRD